MTGWTKESECTPVACETRGLPVGVYDVPRQTDPTTVTSHVDTLTLARLSHPKVSSGSRVSLAKLTRAVLQLNLDKSQQCSS